MESVIKIVDMNITLRAILAQSQLYEVIRARNSMHYKLLNAKQNGNDDSTKMKHKKKCPTSGVAGSSLPRILLQIF